MENANLPEKPQQENQEAAASQPAPQATAPQSAPPQGGNVDSSSSKKLGIIIGGVILIGAAIAGYGYYNGTQVKAYAEKSEKMVTQFKNFTDKMDKEDDLRKAKDSIKELKTASESNLSDLEKTKAPAKAKELESNLKEYFTEAKTLLVASEAIIDWADEFEKVFKDLGNLGSSSAFDPSSPQSMAQSLKDAKKEVDKASAKLKDLEAPKGLEKQQKAFEDMLKDISTMYDKMIVAAEAGDSEGLIAAANSFDPSKFQESADFSQNPFDKEYKSDVDKAKELEKKITDEIGALKNAGTFVF